jgi:uncharacterized protein (DUF2147 family)
MKHLLVVILFSFMLGTILLKAQEDDICGYWRTMKGNTQIQIFKANNGMVYGKIVWLRIEKERPDFKNPIEKLRSRKVLGLQNINNFIYNEKEQLWEKGTIYDPENGNTYYCILWLTDTKDILKLKGHLPGMRVLSRQTEWIRESKLRQ